MAVNDNGYMVCGWYTPGYAVRAEALMASLNAVGEPHDFQAVEDRVGGWERATMRKPGEIMQAMTRHSNKTIIFMDVDCIVMESLAPLAKTQADVAVHLMAGRRSRGYGRLFARSTVMVFRPTLQARGFVFTWERLSRDAPRGQVDQHTLTEAIALTPGLVIEHLDARWCAMDKDEVMHPAIVHDGAARRVRKIPGWIRALYSFTHSARS